MGQVELEGAAMTSDEQLEALQHTLGTRGWLEIIEPAINAGITAAEEQWLSGRRPEGQSRVTDEMLKERVSTLRWMLRWRQKAKRLVQELELQEKLSRETEAATDSASPYA